MIKSLSIAFDSDGVLFDTEAFQIKYGSKYFSGKYGLSVKNENAYRIKDLFDCSDTQEIAFWTRYLLRYSYFYKPRRYVAQVIRDLRRTGHKVSIVTSKGKAQEKIIGPIVKFFFESGLLLHGIRVDDIHYCSVENSAADKAAVCRRFDFDIFVEDYKENVIELSKLTKVLCMKTRNNQGCEGQNIIRVNGFGDVYTEIKKYVNSADAETREEAKIQYSSENEK